MEPKEMIVVPFTHFDDKGVVGMMGDDLYREVISIVERIKNNAVPELFSEQAGK